MRWLNYKYLFMLGVLFLCIAIPRLYFPDFDHSDDYSDSDVMVSGENFVKFGFIKSRFLPLFDVQQDKPAALYTHYPSLTSVINGVQHQIFKTDSLYPFRGMALFVTFFNVLFWYLFIRRFSGSYFFGFLAAIFYLTNPMTIFCADALHQPSYGDFLRSLILFTFLIITSPSISARARSVLFWALWLMILTVSLTGFEYIVYLSVFFVLFRYFSKTVKTYVSWGAILMLLTAPVIGALVHFAQNVWYFGSLPAAFQSLKDIAIERATKSRDAPVAGLNLLIWWQYVIVAYFSAVFIFNYFILSVMAFISYLFYKNISPESRLQIKRLLRLCVLLVICGISWYVVFPSHSVAHSFVLFLSRHLIAVAALVFAIFFYTFTLYIKERNPKSVIAKFILAAGVVYVSISGVLRSDLPITKEKFAYAQDFVIVKQHLQNLRDMSDPKDEIGLNYFRKPFVRYYTHRRCAVIHNKADLESLKTLPKYFIFIPYNNQQNQELYQTLSQKYVVLFQCPAARFPSVFLKLKNEGIDDRRSGVK